MQSDQIRTGELLMRSVKVVQAFAVLIVFPVIFTGKGFLALFAGQGYEAAYPILLLLVVPFLICLPAYLFTSFLYASARHELTARLLMIEAITNLVLSLTLIRWLGPVGVAIGTFVPALIFRGILLPREALRIASLDGARYWREMIWRPLPAAVAIVVALELGTLCFGATTLSGWLLTNTLGVLGFSLVAPAVFMSPKEQRSVLNWLHSLH
jgi:O-antigen/teichoic acid export membrane protein